MSSPWIATASERVYSVCEAPLRGDASGGELLTNYPVVVGLVALAALIMVAVLSKWLHSHTLRPVALDDIANLRRQMRLHHSVKAGVPYATGSVPGSSRR